MAIPTTTDAILRGRISTYLSANYVSEGALWGARKAPISPVTIAIVTDALEWGSIGGAQSAQSVRNTTNYLIWLIGQFGQEAQAISEGGGGGTVIPGGDVVTPITISGADFESATNWDNAGYANKQLVVFSNGIARYLTVGTEWTYTTTGITILMPGFDSALMDYTMVITIVR